MKTHNAITVRQVSKSYGEKQVIDEVSFDVVAGEITLLAGPNGAGKSTLLRMICGLEDPDAGATFINGQPYRALVDPICQVGFLLDATWLNADLTAAQNLTVLARLAGIDQSRVTTCLELTGLGSAAHRPVAEFSLGMRQRCGIAAALLGDPKVLVLDEPVNGLDPAGMAWLNEFLRSHCDRGGTVLISSHFLADSELLASRVVILGKGRTLWQGLMAELTAGAQAATFSSTDNSAVLASLRMDYRGLEAIHLAGGMVRVAVDPLAVSQAARAAGADLLHLAQAKKSLAEAYQHISEREVEYQ